MNGSTPREQFVHNSSTLVPYTASPLAAVHGEPLLNVGSPGIFTRDGVLRIASTSHRDYPRGIPAYNFEAEQGHTYFVGSLDAGGAVASAQKLPTKPHSIGRIRERLCSKGSYVLGRENEGGVGRSLEPHLNG